MKKLAIATVPFLIFSSLNIHAEIINSLTPIPDPLSGINPLNPQQSLSLPSAGSTFTEPLSGLSVTRLTNDESQGARHEYSRFDPYNKDRSKIILHTDQGFESVYTTQSYPYNAAGNQVTSLAGQINVLEARWDRNETNKIWGFSGSSIKTVDLSSSTPVVNVVKNFSQDTNLTSQLGYSNFTITMNNEGESSYDNKYWAFLAKDEGGSGKQHIVSWDRDNDQILGTYELTNREKDYIDWVGMSPKGNYVLVGSLDYDDPGLTGAKEILGLAMANKDLTTLTGPTGNKKLFHRLNYDTAHSDVGLDSNGNEVIVMQNTRTDFIDLIPIDPTTVSINDVGASYDGTNRTKLVRMFYDSSSPESLNLFSGVHISGNYDGYALISTTIEQGVAEQNWLEKVLLLVKLDTDNPLAGYISKTYNTTGTVNGRDNFWEETHGTITNDGSKVLWAANWDLAGTGEYADLDNFLLEADLTNLASVPIPGAFVLLGSGLIGLVGISRRRRKN